jgi:hypothetical protein
MHNLRFTVTLVHTADAHSSNTGSHCSSASSVHVRRCNASTPHESTRTDTDADDSSAAACALLTAPQMLWYDAFTSSKCTALRGVTAYC